MTAILRTLRSPTWFSVLSILMSGPKGWKDQYDLEIVTEEHTIVLDGVKRQLPLFWPLLNIKLLCSGGETQFERLNSRSNHPLRESTDADVPSPQVKYGLTTKTCAP